MSQLIIPGHLRPLTTYIAGNPGYGKSSLMQRMALYDIKMKRGVAIIDPTGDLVNRLVHWIPRSRINDTVWFDTDDPIPIDLFSYEQPSDRQVLMDQLIATFQLDNAPIAKPRLGDILTALFDANEKINDPNQRYTFLDILPFIQDEAFRERLFKIRPDRRADWKDGMPSPKDMSPITDRLRPFRNIPALRMLFGSKNGVKVSDLMREKKIFLMNLKDTPTDYFIGSLITSKFQQASFARRYLKESDRIPYYLYIDECHTIMSYAVKEFEAILTRARKYKLCLILANQIPTDLPPEIQRKLGTIGNLILFNLEYKDAKVFQHLIAPIEPEYLMQLAPFKAIARIDRRVSSLTTPPFLPKSTASYAHIVKKRHIENGSCGTEKTGFNRVNDSRTAHADEPEDEGIRPAGTPEGISSHRSKKEGPRNPR